MNLDALGGWLCALPVSATLLTMLSTFLRYCNSLSRELHIRAIVLNAWRGQPGIYSCRSRFEREKPRAQNSSRHLLKAQQLHLCIRHDSDVSTCDALHRCSKSTEQPVARAATGLHTPHITCDLQVSQQNVRPASSVQQPIRRAEASLPFSRRGHRLEAHQQADLLHARPGREHSR